MIRKFAGCCIGILIFSFGSGQALGAGDIRCTSYVGFADARIRDEDKIPAVLNHDWCAERIYELQSIGTLDPTIADWQKFASLLTGYEFVPSDGKQDLKYDSGRNKVISIRQIADWTPFINQFSSDESRFVRLSAASMIAQHCLDLSRDKFKSRFTQREYDEIYETFRDEASRVAERSGFDRIETIVSLVEKNDDFSAHTRLMFVSPWENVRELYCDRMLNAVRTNDLALIDFD